MKKNGFEPLVIILVIAILGATGYLFVRFFIPPITFNSTSNWKTYYNKDVGYSLKYPNNFVDRIGGSSMFLGSIKKLSVGDDQFLFVLRTSTDSASYTLEKLKQISQSTKMIGSYTVYLSSLSADGGEFTASAIIPYEKYFIDISISPNNSNKNFDNQSQWLETEKIRDQILSTFKFTK